MVNDQLLMLNSFEYNYELKITNYAGFDSSCPSTSSG